MKLQSGYSSVVVLSLIAWSLFVVPSVHAQLDPSVVNGALQNLSLESSETEALNSMVDLLYERQDTTWLRRNIILHFCDTVLQTREDANMTEVVRDKWAYRYDPKQSLFVYSMCVHMDEVWKGRTIVKEKYRYRDYQKVFWEVNSFWKLEQGTTLLQLMAKLWWIPDQDRLDSESAYTACNPATSMQNCRFSRFAPVIFQSIMNDYSNIKLATIYWFRYPLFEWEDAITQSIDDFNASYFGDLAQPTTPCNEEGIGYIWKEWLEWDQRHCLHPATYKELEETIKSSEKIMNKVVFLDTEALFTVESEGACDYENPKRSLLRCSAWNWGDIATRSDRQSFYNLYLNELMRYSLFLDYYLNTINENNTYSPLTFGSLSYTFKQNEKEAATITYEKALSQQATSQTLRMLSNVYTTFPVYIALRAYREDLLLYRSTIAKVFTPMDQMYYKFRNVQEAWEEGS